jgi:hypothetical protein
MLLIDAAKLQLIVESTKILGYSASICDELHEIISEKQVQP